MKLIFSDLDGTLLNTKHQIDNKTRVSILNQIENGNIFVPVSARMPQAIRNAVNSLGSGLPIIAYNGGLILSGEGQKLYSKTFSIDLAFEIIKLLTQDYPDLAWNVYSDDIWLSPRKLANLNEEKIVKLESKYAEIDQIRELANCHKILLIADPVQILNFKKELSIQYPDLNCVCSADNLLEINPKGIDKGTAIKKVMDYYKVSFDDTWAFGDNFNDLPMLREVAHPVLMANAPDVLKSRGFQLTNDNNHCGIAEVLRSC